MKGDQAVNWKYVVLVDPDAPGGSLDDVQCYGPFDSEEEADQFGRTACGGDTWSVVSLMPKEVAVNKEE